MSKQRVHGARCPRDHSQLQYFNDWHHCPNCTYSITDLALYEEISGMFRFPPKNPGSTGVDPKPKPKPEKKCECGVDAAGGGKHSKWCPLYKEDE